MSLNRTVWQWRSWRGSLLALAALGLVACGGESAPDGAANSSDEASMGKIEGAVVYRERMALPPGAEVEVQLEDISRADAPATVIATVTLRPETGPPYPFTIEYDPARIEERMLYALRGTIRVDGRLMFTSTEFIEAFSGNPLEVLVQRVPRQVKASGPALEETRWVLATLNGESAPTGAQGKALDMQFDASALRAGGFSGCNRFSGGYAREGTSTHGSPLTFGMMAATLMACPEGEDVERTYLQMLGSVTAFRINGKTLSLLSGDGTTVATYTAQ